MREERDKFGNFTAEYQAILDADYRGQFKEQRHEQDFLGDAELAEWRRVTGIRDGDQHEGGRQVRQLLNAHAVLGIRLPSKIVQIEREALGRDLTLLEMWTCLQPTDSDLAAGWKLPDTGATVSDVLPGCDVPQHETAEESRQRQLDDWRNWNPDTDAPARQRESEESDE